MIDDFFVDVTQPDFKVEVVRVGDSLHFSMLGNIDQLLFYAVADPRIKENVMSHADVYINKHLDFLIFGAAFTEVDDAISILQDSIETLLNTMREGIRLRNSRGFLMLHRKPTHLGYIVIDGDIDKFTKKKLMKMCETISDKFRDCVKKGHNDSRNLIDLDKFNCPLNASAYRYVTKPDMRDAVCQKIEPVADKILKNLDDMTGLQVTSKPAFDRIVSTIRVYVAYKETSGWRYNEDVF